jgi:alpha-amylase/alpha-mannosidase (GH57 family)
MEMSAAAVELVLLWHHHQPDYRDPDSGVARLPWVRLHGTKDYLDMARRLERFPGVRVTFNFVPSLVDQIEAAAAGGADRLFDLVRRPVESLTLEERAIVARRCVQVPPHAVARWSELRDLRDAVTRSAEPPGGDVLLALENWFLLAWLDPMFLAEPEAAAALAANGHDSTAHRDALVALHQRLLGEILPAYRALHDRGQIELSASPYYHPILPLLVDVRSLQRARPDLPVPREAFAAPEDARRQIESALVRHAQVFGARPRGLWPSEGSVSPEVAELAAALGLTWLATDQAVLERSLDQGVPGSAYRPWRLTTAAGDITLLFRDHELSDRIGFVYQRWSAQDAVVDFMARIRRIGREHGGDDPALVAVMLDGENCWEGYPEDGGPFLDGLYEALQSADDVRTTTPSEAIARRSAIPVLPRLHSGSWIDADFHIWAGHREKNRAWELLARARRTLATRSPEERPAAWEALMRAEGSDWFWWFGDDHYTPEKHVFDELFRGHLKAIYRGCGEPVPLALDVPIAAPAPVPGSIVLPVAYVQPVIDGRETHFYEWQPAGHRAVIGHGAAMHSGNGWISDVYYGFDAERLFLRFDFLRPPDARRGLRIEILEPAAGRLEIAELTPGTKTVMRRSGDAAPAPLPEAEATMGSILEIAVPATVLGIHHGEGIQMLIQILEEGRPIETIPPGDALRFSAPDESFDVSVWNP